MAIFKQFISNNKTNIQKDWLRVHTLPHLDRMVVWYLWKIIKISIKVSYIKYSKNRLNGLAILNIHRKVLVTIVGIIIL